MSDKPVTMAAAPAVAAIVTTLPYLIEGVTLLTKYVSTLTADEVDPNDLEAVAALQQKFKDSAADADAALDSLKAAIDARRTT